GRAAGGGDLCRLCEIPVAGCADGLARNVRLLDDLGSRFVHRRSGRAMGRKENPVSVSDASMLSIGGRLRQLRRSHGLSLTDLAARLGYSKPYLSAVENGTAKPAKTIVCAYAKAFGVPTESLAPDTTVLAETVIQSGPQLDTSVVRIAQEFG